jgi:membrane-bound lytic murein transglycosylase B
MPVRPNKGLVGLVLLGALVFQFFYPSVLLAAGPASEAERARLEAELAAQEREIAIQTALLAAKQKETATVTGEIKLLQSQIAQAQKSIAAKKAAISRLTDGIAVRTVRINTLNGEIADRQDSLAELLRQTRESDIVSLPEIMLSGRSFSDFFRSVDAFRFVEKSLETAFESLRGAQDKARAEQTALAAERDEAEEAQLAIEAERARVAQKERERQAVLTVTKGQEAAYAKVLAEKQKRAAEIRAALFALRDSAAIPFGDALAFATTASQKTGVRPAFILAILQQESNLGQNQGSCLLASLETGDGVGKNTGTFFEQVMKAPRDTAPFQSITSRLSRDWKSTPVSCPIGGSKYYVGRGFGGAMGPAQFIPSTWELTKNQVGGYLGLQGDQVDPWNPGHAIMSSAAYLGNLGAKNGNYTSEIKAACKYYGSGGSNCTYGKQVMAKANTIQTTMIDPLQNI